MTTGARSPSGSRSPTTRYQVRWPSRSRYPSTGATLRGGGPGGVERPGDVLDEVGGVLDPGAQPDEALGHGVGAPARAALGVRVHAAEARGLGDVPAALEELLGARRGGQREAHHRAHARPP